MTSLSLKNNTYAKKLFNRNIGNLLIKKGSMTNLKIRLYCHRTPRSIPGLAGDWHTARENPDQNRTSVNHLYEIDVDHAGRSQGLNDQTDTSLHDLIGRFTAMPIMANTRLTHAAQSYAAAYSPTSYDCSGPAMPHAW